MIIVFSGTDGAGKSTQIERLMLALEDRGKKPVYLWSRGGYTPLFSRIKDLARVLLGKKLPKSGRSQAREKLLNKGFVSHMWLIIAIADLILLYGVYVRWLKARGKIVVCDRYIEDTYLDFKYNFGTSFNPNGILWKTLLMVSPEPDYAFLLTVPVDVSLYRSQIKNEPFPDSRETLEWRLTQYNDESVFPANKFYRIDCQQDIDAIQELIQDKIFSADKPRF